MNRRSFLNIGTWIPGINLFSNFYDKNKQKIIPKIVYFSSVNEMIKSSQQGCGEKTIWRAGHHAYIETKNDGHDVIKTSGGILLRVIPDSDNAYDMLAFGAADDETTDESDLIEKISKIGGNIKFPNKIAISRTIKLNGIGKKFIFNSSKFYLINPGVFDKVFNYGSGLFTGYRTVISIGDQENGCRKCVFSGSLSLVNNNTHSSKLCFIAASKLGNAMLNSFDAFITVNCKGISKAIVGQGTTKPVPGSFTGSFFKFIETFGDCGAFELRLNQDDIIADCIRDRSNSILDTELIVRSYYMYGQKIENYADGLTLGSFALFQCNHHFIEGYFNFPIVLKGHYNVYRSTIRISKNFKSNIDNFVIMVGADKNVVDIKENPKSLQGGHLGYIYRYALSKNSSGKFILSRSTINFDKRKKLFYKNVSNIRAAGDVFIET